MKYLATSSGGLTPSKDKPQYWDGDIPWVTPKDMKRPLLADSQDHVSALALAETGLKLHPPEGVMVVTRGMILAHTFPVARNAVAVTVNQDMRVLRSGPATDTRYLAWLLQGLSPVMLSLTDESAHGTKALRTDQWENLPVPTPKDRGLQERIANFLDEQTARIDALIAEKERCAELTEEWRTTRIRELVTGSAEGKTQRTGMSWAPTIPAGWSSARIKHVARLESGHTPDKKVPEYWTDCDIPWVSLNDTGQLLEVDYIYQTATYVNELGIQNSSARLLPKGTVFFSRDATIGRCGIAARPMACSQHFIGWVCSPLLVPEYLLYTLRSMSDELDRLTMGATLKTIGMDDVKTLRIPLPPLETQKEIIQQVLAVNERARALAASATSMAGRLREYRSSLISAAVTGQLDIGALNERPRLAA